MIHPKEVKVTLYDIPTILEGKTFSPFVIKVRLALNFKRIPFETFWVHFPDVEKTAKAIGAPHSRILPDGTKEYTVPMVIFDFPDGKKDVVSDSEKIAKYLDATFADPERTLFPRDTLVLQSVFSDFVRRQIQMSSTFLKVNITSILHALPPHTRDWWIATRPRAFGRAYEDYAPNTPERRAKAWETYESVFDKIAAYLDAAGEGNHRLSGGTVTYAEIELAAWLKTIQLIGADDGWKGLKDRNGGRWAKLVDEPEYKYVMSTAYAQISRL